MEIQDAASKWMEDNNAKWKASWSGVRLYDQDGQLLTTNFAEYLLPNATGLPEITTVALEESASKFNPMGFKGAGEGGIVAGELD